MKNLLIIALLVFSVHAFAQDSGTKKNEIGINVFSVVSSVGYEPWWYGANDLEVSYKFATGAMYKHHWNKNTLRVSLDYYYANEKYDKENRPFFLEESFLKLVNRTGYQYTFGNWRVKPYVAIDASFGFIRTSQKYEDGYLKFPPIIVEDVLFTYELGLSPVVGVQIQITPRLYATIEASAEVITYLQVQKGKLEGGGGANVLYNPVRLLSVNYHF